MPFQPGQQVGRFKVLRLVAQGGMAEVYRVEQELAGGILRPAALKVIRPEYSESPDFREMFLDEARTACTLSHPNIVHLYEVGEVDGLLFMAMELVPGETLANVARSLREADRRWTDDALLAIGIATCSALEAVHALNLPGEGHLNLVHRDVSPHNLLLSSSGSLKLIDFGISKAVTNRNLTSPGVTKGKAGYFSPEQAMGKSLDGRSDLFSLGVTLYKLACGNTPFDQYSNHLARNQALVAGRWEPLENVCPGLLPGLYRVIGKALQLQPEERYGSAHQMREAFERAALEAGVHVGASSLKGYVTDDGELTPLPGPSPRVEVRPLSERRSAAGSQGAPASSGGRRRTEPADTLKSRWVLLAGLVAASVLVGSGFGVRALNGRAGEPRSTPVTVAVELPQVELPRLVAPEEARGLSPDPAMPPTHIVTSTARAKPPRATRISRRVEQPVRREARTLVPAHVVAAAEPEIPRGEGRLRVGALPEGTVSVGRENWGPAPVDRRVASGVYEVSMVNTGGVKASCEVKVFPDRTTIVIYSFDSGDCRVNE